MSVKEVTCEIGTASGSLCAQQSSVLYRVRGVADVHAVVADRALGHRMVMRWLPDDVLPQANPRQAAGVLWGVEENLHGAALWVRSAVPPQASGVTFEEVIAPVLVTGDRLMMRGQVERTYQAGAHMPHELWNVGVRARGRRVAVPADRASCVAWLTAKLARSGIATGSDVALEMGAARVGGSGSGSSAGSGRRLPTMTFSTEVEITDAAEAQRVVATGFGRGKSYGCGLLLTV